MKTTKIRLINGETFSFDHDRYKISGTDDGWTGAENKEDGQIVSFPDSSILYMVTGDKSVTDDRFWLLEKLRKRDAERRRSHGTADDGD